ncbi:hypothetical protein RZS40_29790, partial [Burkholderia pseudomallei]|nr:hypothetical protein [Burkholderia pseudomallei]MDV2218256.1 hypothetical protein [Burkholderia pseudomallei]
YRFFLEFLGKRTPDHGLALQTTRYLLFEPSKGIEPLHFSASPLLRFSASPLLRFSASPLRFSAPDVPAAPCPPQQPHGFAISRLRRCIEFPRHLR